MDPRLTPARPDLAAAHLEGLVEAARFAPGVTYQVSAGVAPIRKTPTEDGRLETQALFGELFTVYDEANGFGWGQAELDGYVGHVAMEALSAPPRAPTHRVNALRSYMFSEPDLKSAPLFLVSLNAKVTAVEAQGRFVRCAGAGWLFAGHLDPISAPGERDFVAVAERFLHAPYLWGGKESLGCDCSGLLQSALERCDILAPRDTDMMEAALGAPAPDRADLRRGDLVFWKGHVGVMVDAVRLLHANAHHMAVAVEPLADAEARIAAKEGPITAVKRLGGERRTPPALTFPRPGPNHAPFRHGLDGAALWGPAGRSWKGAAAMKVKSSLKSLKTRHRACRVVRRKGRVYIINKVDPRFKAKQG